MNVQIESSWKSHLNEEFNKEYFAALTEYVKNEYSSTSCFPPGKEVFACFDHCPFDKVKVVIIGQDPYIRPGQAHGLCFSVREGVDFPPSLRNIFQEIKEDIGNEMPGSGDLTHWAEQGVLLLNATLTVREGLSGSHQGKGWETFTDAVIHKVNEELNDVVFLLWGSFAQKKASFLNKEKHHVLKAPHPSPLSAYRGFFGSKHFSQCNEILGRVGKDPIKW